MAGAGDDRARDARIGFALILLGVLWVAIGVLAGRHARPLWPNTPPEVWQLAWWEQFGWANGLLLILLGVGVLVFRALRKKAIPFGDRIRRDYK